MSCGCTYMERYARACLIQMLSYLVAAFPQTIGGLSMSRYITAYSQRTHFTAQDAKRQGCGQAPVKDPSTCQISPCIV